MAFLAQGKARFLCLEAGGMLADRKGEHGVLLDRGDLSWIPRPERRQGAHRVGSFSASL